MKKKALIVSIKGINLTHKEKLLLRKEKPWGIILFKRNIKSLKQITNLIKEIKKYAKDKKFPILIDEEGATVSRLKDIFNHGFNACYFGDLFKKDKVIAINIYKQYLRYLCKELRKIGFNINTIPVLDVLRKNTNKII
jgi:beta-N-acetylhexosaminidase